MDKLEYIPGDLVMTNGVPLGTAKDVVYRVTSSDPSKTLELVNIHKLSLRDMKIKNLPKKIYLNICSNEDEVDYNELNGVTFSTEKIGVTDCNTENVPYVNAASLWHDLKEEKPPLKKWVMFRYSGRGVNPTALHYGAMSDDIWVVTRGDGTQRIEVLYECYDKIEWFDFDELK